MLLTPACEYPDLLGNLCCWYKCHVSTVVHYHMSTTVVMYEFYCTMCNIWRMCCIIIVLHILHVLLYSYKVQYTETSLTSFMTFWILAQILWKNSTHLHVLLLLFIILLCKIIPNVFWANYCERKASSFCTCTFLPADGQYIESKHVVQNNKWMDRVSVALVWTALPVTDWHNGMMLPKNHHISSELVWDCHELAMKLNKHDTVQMIWMPWHGRMYGQDHWAAGKNRIWMGYHGLDDHWLSKILTSKHRG